jgi:hypothetical protein
VGSRGALKEKIRERGGEGGVKTGIMQEKKKYTRRNVAH